MSQQGRTKSISLLDFYSMKGQDDSMENTIACSDKEAAASVSAECACRSDKWKLPTFIQTNFRRATNHYLALGQNCQVMTFHYVQEKRP